MLGIVAALLAVSAAAFLPQSDNDRHGLQLFTVGDGHAYYGMESLIENVADRVQWTGMYLGTIKLFSLMKEGINAMNFKAILEPPPNSIIAVSVGEDDARRFLARYKGADLDKTIADLVGGYERTMLANAANLPNAALWVMSLPPPADSTVKRMVPIITSGSNEERVEYTRMINTALKDMAERNGWNFFERFEEHANENGLLRKEISDGYIYITAYGPSTRAAFAAAVEAHIAKVQAADD